MRAFFIIAIASACSVVYVPGAHADSADGSTVPYTLGAVVVNSTSAPPAGENVQSVNDQQIDELGARSLDEALRATPGVTINPGPQGIPNIMVRGLPPRQTQIFLNGVPMDAASNGQFDPSLIPTGYISRVDVLEGASSVLYGPGTDAGVINIVTKRGDDGLHGGVTTEFGSDDSRHVVANLSGGNDTVNFFVSGSQTGSDGYELPDGTQRTNSDTQRNNLFANVGVHLGDWQVGVTATTVDGHEGLPPNTISSPALNRFTTGQLYERITDLSGQSAQVDAAYRPGGPLSLRFSAYVNTLHTVEDRYDNASYSTMTNPAVQTFHEIDDMTVSGGQAQARYDFGRFGSLTGALSFREEQDVLTGTARDVPLVPGSGGGDGGGGGGGTQDYAVRALDQNDIARTYSGALEYQVDPTKRLHLTAGYSHHVFGTPSGTEQGDQWMLGSTYDLTRRVQPFASYSRKILFPTLDELYDPQQGNPTLQPERSTNLEGGFVFTVAPGNRVTIDAFNNRVDNFIQNDPANQVFVNSDVTVNGVEVSGEFSPVSNLVIHAGYTYMHVYSPTTGLPQNYRPAHVLDLTAAWRFIPTWRLSADVSEQLGNSVEKQVTRRYGCPFQAT